MAEVTLSIGGRAYRLGCRDGEEAALRAAGSLLESRVATLMRSQGSIPEPRLLLMAGLLLSGELLEQKSSDARLTTVPVNTGNVDADRLRLMAERLESLALTLEKAANTP